MNWLYGVTCFIVSFKFLLDIESSMRWSHLFGISTEPPVHDPEEEIKSRKRELVRSIEYMTQDVLEQNKFTISYEDAYKQAEKIVLEKYEMKLKLISDRIKELAKKEFPLQPDQ